LYNKGYMMALSRHTRGLIGAGLAVVGMVAIGETIGWEPRPREPRPEPVREKYISCPGLLRTGFIMCVSEDALSKSHALRKSGRMDMLHDIGCVGTSRDHDAVLTDWGFAVSEVRVKPNGGGASRAFFVASEALVRQAP
jgi:hypothetical protein